MPEQNQQTTIPKYLFPTFFGPTGFFDQYANAQAGLPSIEALAGMVPGLQVPNLSPDQEALLKQLEASGASQTDLAQARQQLQQLTSGPIGSSPATAAGMKAFQDIVLPQVEQQQALAGTASGGAGLEAVANATSAAALPLIQNEIQTRQQAVGQYADLGNQQLQELVATLQASGLPREVALEQAQAMFDQASGKFQYEAGLQTAPLSSLPAFLGSRSHPTMTSEDYIAGIGKGLSPSGLFGGGG